MNKISAFVLIISTVGSFLSFGQENTGILKAPETWQHEIIPFPLSFAPEIDFVGFEDLRFSHGWSDSSSQEFWTYSFAWYIELDSAMTEKKLIHSFNIYYDGLMGVNLKRVADTINAPKIDMTLSSFIKTNIGFTGEMRVYDSFFTKNYIILNIKVKEYICPGMNKQIILCNISPKPFNHRVWEIFNDVKIMVACE